MIRPTYKLINLDNLKYNVQEIIKYTKDYKYHFGVVKADCYNNTIKSIKTIIEAGINYLAVSSLEEALKIRKITDMKILILEPISIKSIDKAIKNNITLTVSSIDYLNKIKDKKCTIHLKINTGMNRLGLNNKKEFDLAYNIIRNSNIYLEGIYTHLYNANDYNITKSQYDLFKNITSNIDLSTVDIIHIPSSDGMINYPKMDFVNGCRLGIIMYGFNNKLKLKDVFSVKSKVIEIHKLKKGDTLGYNGTYKANDDTLIGVIPIGYADGIIRENKNRYVYINDKKYYIVGNICMDMLFVKIDDTIKVNDNVDIIMDNSHMLYVSKYLNTIPYEVMCLIKRVNTKYIICKTK